MGEGMHTKVMHSSSQQSSVFTATLSGPPAVALVAAFGIAGKEEVGSREN